MGGTMSSNEREAKWSSHRAFSVTPQILLNDIKKGICKASEISCIVIDEAHKAQGNYAYCDIIKEISSVTFYFRY